MTVISKTASTALSDFLKKSGKHTNRIAKIHQKQARKKKKAC